MSVRPTRSRDGVPRITVRVEHRLSREDYVEVLAAALADNLDEIDQPVGQTRAADLVRRLLGREGTDWWSWTEERDPDEIDEARDLATRSVNGFWRP